MRSSARNKNPLQEVARDGNSSTGTRTGNERALFLRGFCDSQNLGEQFGEQTAIFEQILTLFEKLDADQKKRLLGMLTDRMEVMND